MKKIRSMLYNAVLLFFSVIQYSRRVLNSLLGEAEADETGVSADGVVCGPQIVRRLAGDARSIRGVGNL